jgi:MEMO1 family protein
MLRVISMVMLVGLVVGCSEKRPAPGDTENGEKGQVASLESPDEKPKLDPDVVTTRRIENAFPAQVAGGFYPQNPGELRRQVNEFLQVPPEVIVGQDRDIVGILCPHAGYRYSGPVAGQSFGAVRGRDYRTVVVVALSHRQGALKASVLHRPAYDTPLGSLEIDNTFVKRLLAEHGDLFDSKEAVFRTEHSLEVQLPFIQVALPEAKVVPIIVAVHDDQMTEKIGEALFEVFGKRQDVLFAVSSDLSHFFPYQEAVALDNKLLEQLASWQIDEWKQQAVRSKEGMCGFRPMQAFVGMFGRYAAADRQVVRLEYKNSGDTSGDKTKGVVGYGSLAFTLKKGVRMEKGAKKDFGPFGLEERRYLMGLAKRSVAAAAKGEKFNAEQPAIELLADKGAAFVTLKKDGQLRGCIGHVVAHVPLYQCVADVARSATIHDRRFRPVSPEEVENLDFEISVLTAPELTTPDNVVVGRDGLIMSNGGRSGLLLPQVPVEWGWDKDEFLAHTCRKAGLPTDCWKDPATEIKSFRAIVWGVEDLD